MPLRQPYPAEPLLLPGCTAYAEPDPEGASFSEESGIADWKPGQALAWYGYLARSGPLVVSVGFRLAPGEAATLRLRAEPVGRRGRQERLLTLDGAGRRDAPALAIDAAGYWRFTLERLHGAAPQVVDLSLDGPAAQGARFNRKERRNAASVHLGFPIEKEFAVAAFANTVTVRADPLWSYTMACGWHRGYFGIQVNSPTERRIIFSVWDSGNEAVDPRRVAVDDRVQLLEKGDGVFADRFGNEGTGGHSHLVYPWRRGRAYRFGVSARPDGAATVYAGWFWFPERRAWGLIARFRAPRDGGLLRGLYSFSENFGGANGQRLRRAEFGPAWARSPEGAWRALTRARFTCDATGRAGDRLDFAAGALPGGRFFLQHGGFEDNGVRFGDVFETSAVGQPPQDLPE